MVEATLWVAVGGVIGWAVVRLYRRWAAGLPRRDWEYLHYTDRVYAERERGA